MQFADIKNKIVENRKTIWMEMPDEVKRISVGDVARGTSVYGQYLTVLLFASSEMRTLSDEILWGLRESARSDDIDMKGLLVVSKQLLIYKMQFLDFVGLTESSALLNDYIESLDGLADKRQFIELTDEMLTYVNRAHMWVDLVIPWGVTMGFQKNPLGRQ